VEQGLTGQRVDWICEDSDGVVWAGMMTGITRLKDNQLRRINRDNGLFDNNIFAIVPDKLGNLWVNSGRGIFSVTRQSLNDFADGRTDHVECTAYDGPDCVQPSDKTVQEHSACITSDGRVWFPTSRGVVVIDPAHVPTNPTAPPVHLDRLRANGIGFSTREKVVVQPGKGELEIHFTAPSFIAPRKVRFRCQLVGYDKDWVEIGDRRLALYTNLRPGRYTFRIIASNADGIWNTTGDAVEIQLLPHFYQTAWFYLLCGTFAAGTLAGGYGCRVRHLNRKQRALQEAHDLLETSVRERTTDLAKANTSLKNEIEERKRMGLEVERVHRQLIDASRQAGMAEVATSVLHNVGNVLNSVNVSATLVADQLKQSRISGLVRAVALMKEHATDLGSFVTNDPKGKQLPGFLEQLAEHLAAEQDSHLNELGLLRENVGHIKEIVAMQQSYARVSGVAEVLKVTDLVEDALRMNATALVRHEVQLVRDYGAPSLEINIEKHKVLQILVNLIRNAKYACNESGRKDKRLTVRVTNGDGFARVEVIDNGIGIAAENLTRIFNHGFTTRKDGHGFGLHSGALAATEMGGTLQAHSEGVGRGATFTLQLPVRPSVHRHDES
jgi:signal transduction histidine kinase